MRHPISAGQLTANLSFQKPVRTRDEVGGISKQMEDVFSCRGRIMPLRGGETVMAGRLAGRKTVVVTIRSFRQSRAVTTDWSVLDKRSDTQFNIRDINMSVDRLWLDILCESE